VTNLKQQTKRHRSRLICFNNPLLIFVQVQRANIGGKFAAR